MKTIRTDSFASLYVTLAMFSLVSSLAVGAAKPRVIEMNVQKVGDATHWEPEEIHVKQGEKVKFVLNYKLEGGFDFHGFSIPALKIEKSVDRNKTLEVPLTVTLKPGTYDIVCQFHPKHVGSKLIVDAKAGKSKGPAKLDSGGGSPAQPDQEPSK